jgi:hypothetical protein
MDKQQSLICFFSLQISAELCRNIEQNGIANKRQTPKPL